MGLSRSRTITLIVALATLTSNTLSSLLFAQLPDDPYHLANNFNWYLHFANILSIFGFIGALRQNPLSIAIFANYLILDTLLSSIPRFAALTLLNTLSSTLCSDSSSIAPSPLPKVHITSATYSTNHLPSSSTTSYFSNVGEILGWGVGAGQEEECLGVLELAQVTLAAGVLAATVLQFVGALGVREYAKMLAMRELAVELGVEDGLLGRGDLSETILETGALRNEAAWRAREEETRGRFVEEWGFEGCERIEEGKA